MQARPPHELGSYSTGHRAAATSGVIKCTGYSYKLQEKHAYLVVIINDEYNLFNKYKFYYYLQLCNPCIVGNDVS